MNPNEVIDAYLADVMRRVPGGARDGIDLELRGLLADMLDDRAREAGRPADDAMVLELLRGFGTPAEVAARYRAPGLVIVPAEQTRTFAWMALVGVGLQWALTLPGVFRGESFARWWLSWGLGALWWPGLMVMLSLLAAWLRQRGLPKPAWSPHLVDPERVHRGAMAFGLAGFVVGVAGMTSLPWLVNAMPPPLPGVLAFDPAFLHGRAWLALPLWIGHFVVMARALSQGRWSVRLRRLDIAFDAAWLLLLGWWVATGGMFLAEATDQGARGGIALVMVFVAIDLVVKLRRRQRAPRLSSTLGRPTP